MQKQAKRWQQLVRTNWAKVKLCSLTLVAHSTHLHTHTQKHRRISRTSVQLATIGEGRNKVQGWQSVGRLDKAREVFSGRRPAPTVQNKSSAITLQVLGPHKYLYSNGKKLMFCIIVCWTMQLMGNWQDATTSQRIKGITIDLLCCVFHIASLSAYFLQVALHTTRQINRLEKLPGIYRPCSLQANNPLPSIDKLLPGDPQSLIITAIFFGRKIHGFFWEIRVYM